MVFSPTLYSETFLFSFGLIASTICCVFTRGRSRSRGQRRHQAPSSPQPPPLTAFNTRIRQQTPAPKSTATTLASPQPPIHLRSNSAPISNRSPSRHSSRPKPDASSHSQKKPDTRPILSRSHRTTTASSSAQTAPIVLIPSQKEADSPDDSPPRPPRSPLYPAYDKLDVEKLILQLNEMKHITLDQSALLPAENHLHQKQLLA